MIDKPDHDILTSIVVKVDQICINQGEMKKDIVKLRSDVLDNAKNYISKRMFLGINSIIIFLVISLFVYTSTIQKEVIENTITIEHIEETLEKL